MKSDCVVFVLAVSRTCAMIQCLLAASALRWSLSLSLSPVSPAASRSWHFVI